MLSLCVFIDWSNHVLLPLSHLFAAANKSLSTHGIPCSLPGTVVQGVVKNSFHDTLWKSKQRFDFVFIRVQSSFTESQSHKFSSRCFSSPLFPLPPIFSLTYIFLQGLRGKLRLIYVSRCAVSPIGNVCVMASLRVLSRLMRIQRSRRPAWTLCRQAPAGSPKPPFNPCRVVTSIGSAH